MTDIQSILLFPVRDAESRKQFLLASLVMLAAMIIPIIPMLIFMGYAARIMRQVIDEDKEPSMLEWHGRDWGALLQEGLRIFGVRLAYVLPIMLLMGCGFIFMITSPILLTSTSEGDFNPLTALGSISFIMGIGIFLLAALISLPLGVIIGAAEAHTVAKQSFKAGLQVKEWWPIFRGSLSAFILAYAIVMVAGFVFSIVIQIAAVTIILLCVVPFLMMGYAAYTSLVMSALFAKAYVTGRKALQLA